MSRSPRMNWERSPRGRASNNRSFWTTTDRDLDRASWRRESATDASASLPPTRSGYGSGRQYSSGGDLSRGRPSVAKEGGNSERRHYRSGEEENKRATEGASYIRGSRVCRYPKEFGHYGARGRARGRGREGPRLEMYGRAAGGESEGRRSLVPPAGSSRTQPSGGPPPPCALGDGFETPTDHSSFSPHIENSWFNAAEALRFFQQRWQTVCRELKDVTLTEAERPQMYKADKKSDAGSSVWGQSKLPLQPSVSDFLSELQAALARSESSENGEITS